MHGLTTINKINAANAEARRILNATDPGRKNPVYQGYGKGATTDDAPVVPNASTGLTQEEAEGRN